MPSSPSPESGPHEVAAFLGWLRDRMGDGHVEEWAGSLPAGIDPAPLHHLPPPRDAAAADPGLREWQQAFRPGLFYYRVGPGFLEVRDLRVASAQVRLTIDDEDLISLFGACLYPVRAAGLGRAQRTRAGLLLRERLLLDLDGYLLAAPYRMRRWPLPASRA